jgi:hypothetical protein
MTEQEFREIHRFFSDLAIQEVSLDQVGHQVQVTYTFRGETYTIRKRSRG